MLGSRAVVGRSLGRLGIDFGRHAFKSAVRCVLHSPAQRFTCFIARDFPLVATRRASIPNRFLPVSNRYRERASPHIPAARTVRTSPIKPQRRRRHCSTTGLITRRMQSNTDAASSAPVKQLRSGTVVALELALVVMSNEIVRHLCPRLDEVVGRLRHQCVAPSL